MPSSLSLGESWQLETHSLRAQMSGIRLWHSWLGAGIVEKPVAGCLRGNPGSRCFPTGAIVSFPCIAPHTAPCIHHLWSLPGRRQRLESELHSLQDLFRTQKCQRQKAPIWEIVLLFALALSHIFTRGVHCS